MKPVVIITGASRGLGAAVAEKAAVLGAAVVLSARSEAELAQIAGRIEAGGGTALIVPGDVSRLEDNARLVEQVVTRFGRIDALVNNAGILTPIATFADADPAGWERNFAVNLLGPMMLTQAALPHLQNNNGRVINVSSGAAANPIPGWVAYCAAKAALNQFTAVLAKEEEGITAIAVRPGVVDTAMQATIRREGRANMPAGEHARFVGYYDDGKLLPPERPGAAIALLALYAPAGWSGQFIAWDEERVQRLAEEYRP